MTTRNMNIWRTTLLNQAERSAMPIMTHPGIEMTGHRVIDAVTNGEVHYQAIRAMVTRFPALAATMMSSTPPTAAPVTVATTPSLLARLLPWLQLGAALAAVSFGLLWWRSRQNK